MDVTVDVFLIQEGRDPNPSGKAYLVVPVAEAVAMLGLSDKLEYHPSEMPPRFDGMRSPRYVVAKVDKLAGETLRLRPGGLTERAACLTKPCCWTAPMPSPPSR
jgi:hypothetical protein